MKLLGEFQDVLHPFEGVTNERHSARAFAMDKDDRIALLRMAGTFDGRIVDSYVTPGGGIEPGETPDVAVKREIGEELGCECEVLHEVGIVIDYYNDAKRRNVCHYYVVKVAEARETALTPGEIKVIQGVEWRSLEDTIHLLETYKADPRGATLHRRDLCALMEAKKAIEEFRSRR